ncbi:F-type H+-transporting ATPase subunit delta [Hymenobacter daecheongensis DSM 21074]|uniref:ATP synthase subunit delta n=1 Tax=Hymenobacter daecheongensis DSM 21074 TaxID=1121955 RepID=A0A1M6AAW1_9BACT|nr:ATP synthase F1 subunit delta [Hymenobacter daecheongensis]SHI33611.1 F-type H+-transporting ATPase subunit delta [Hymenobacter daecheongensis DSM 21074]
MSEQRVASRYAKSLLDLAQERGTLEQVKADMDLFRTTLEQSRDLRLLLRNPIVKHDKKLAILRAIFGGKVSEVTEKFFVIVTQHNRESALEWVATEFQSQYDVRRGMQVAQVTTATPLAPALREELNKVVRRQSGLESVTLEETVDESLIGGFILRVGDRQLDESVRNSLRKLRNTFKENPYQPHL